MLLDERSHALPDLIRRALGIPGLRDVDHLAALGLHLAPRLSVGVDVAELRLALNLGASVRLHRGVDARLRVEAALHDGAVGRVYYRGLAVLRVAGAVDGLRGCAGGLGGGVGLELEDFSAVGHAHPECGWLRLVGLAGRGLGSHLRGGVRRLDADDAEDGRDEGHDQAHEAESPHVDPLLKGCCSVQAAREPKRTNRLYAPISVGHDFLPISIINRKSRPIGS